MSRQVLMRLTFTAGELVETEALASAHAVTSGYDLLAVEPTSERVLQQVRRAPHRTQSDDGGRCLGSSAGPLAQRHRRRLAQRDAAGRC